MSEKTEKKKRKPTPPDPGFLPGAAAAVIVLCAWGVIALQPSEATAAESGSGSRSATSRPAVEPAPEHTPPAPRPTVEVTPAVPAWKQDARWQLAGELGEDALDRIDAEVKRHEDEGDPFRFRAEMEECRKQIEKSLQLLDELAADFADDPVALSSIENRRKRFEKKIRATRK
jgi:hypothetical protein